VETHPDRAMDPTDRTVVDLIDRNGAAKPDALALSIAGEQTTNAQLAAYSSAAAAWLHSLGVEQGDRVGIFHPLASVDYLAIALGAMRLGAIAACINARFKTRELQHAIDNSGCRILLHGETVGDVVAASGAAARTRVIDLDGARSHWRLGSAHTPPAVTPAYRVPPYAPARIIYTSGTTSMPKACLHSHRAMLHQGWSVARRLELHAGDRFWAPLPLFHTGGWTPFLAAQSAGAALVHPGIFEGGRSLRQIVDEQCTVLFPGFETIWMQVLGHANFNPADFAHARLVLNVGVPERLEMMQDLLPAVPQVSNTGCTEVGGFLCIGRATDSRDSRCHTAGTPLDGMEARVIDPATGEELPVNEPGELVARGPACLSEYFGDPAATAAAIDDDGWFHTGDLVRRTSANEFVFLSRIKDMLKVGGENVAAAEIEGHILSHPQVHMVAVVSAPDAYYGEVPAAFIELASGASLTEQDVINFCKGQIATFKVPRHVRLVDQWPMAGAKIRKTDLREIIRQSLESDGKVTDNFQG